MAVALTAGAGVLGRSRFLGPEGTSAGSSDFSPDMPTALPLRVPPAQRPVLTWGVLSFTPHLTPLIVVRFCKYGFFALVVQGSKLTLGSLESNFIELDWMVFEGLFYFFHYSQRVTVWQVFILSAVIRTVGELFMVITVRNSSNDGLKIPFF